MSHFPCQICQAWVMCLLLEPEMGPDQHGVGREVFPHGNVAHPEALSESFALSVPQFPQLNIEEDDGCRLDGTCAVASGSPFPSPDHQPPTPPLTPLGHLLITFHYPIGRWTSSWIPACASSTPQCRSPAPPDPTLVPGLGVGQLPALFRLPPPAGRRDAWLPSV